MPTEPRNKRVIAFFDGQNLFHSAQEAFGYTHPNFDPQLLAQSVCDSNSWQLDRVYFYTGVPSASEDPIWQDYWARRIVAMRNAGVYTFTRTLRYQNKIIKISDGVDFETTIPVEKGIDVRIALDVVRLALKKYYDLALIFSQDQDLSEAVKEIRQISSDQNRWIGVASAFPVSPDSQNKRGIDKTHWRPIDRQTYDKCLDPRDYRAGRIRR